MTDAPYVFAVSEYDISLSVPLIAHVWAKLGDSGYKLPGSLTMPPRTAEELRKLAAAAGITRIDHAFDDNKMRHWFKVWPRPPVMQS